jgi:hypothetical protein
MQIGTHIARGQRDRRKASHECAGMDYLHVMKGSAHIRPVLDVELRHFLQRLICVTLKETSISP